MKEMNVKYIILELMTTDLFILSKNELKKSINNFKEIINIINCKISKIEINDKLKNIAVKYL